MISDNYELRSAYAFVNVTSFSEYSLCFLRCLDASHLGYSKWTENIDEQMLFLLHDCTIPITIVSLDSVNSTNIRQLPTFELKCEVFFQLSRSTSTYPLTKP